MLVIRRTVLSILYILLIDLFGCVLFFGSWWTAIGIVSCLLHLFPQSDFLRSWGCDIIAAVFVFAYFSTVCLTVLYVLKKKGGLAVVNRLLLRLWGNEPANLQSSSGEDI
jgi:hypothetical protein